MDVRQFQTCPVCDAEPGQWCRSRTYAFSTPFIHYDRKEITMATTVLDVLVRHGIDPDKAITIWEDIREHFDVNSVENRGTHEVDIAIRCDSNPTLWYFGTDQRAYRLDEQNYHGATLPEFREAQIAMALVDISANRLRDKTL